MVPAESSSCFPTPRAWGSTPPAPPLGLLGLKFRGTRCHEAYNPRVAAIKRKIREEKMNRSAFLSARTCVDLGGTDDAGLESSGTSFFLCGIAWGLNAGILEKPNPSEYLT
jgi:hypothetical protein